MNALLASINPFAFNSDPPVLGSDSVGVAKHPPASIASTELISDISGEEYIPELFSVFVARRSLPKVSPPLPVVQRNIEELLDWDALYDAILPPEPPAFLRKPRPAFLRALFELGGMP